MHFDESKVEEVADKDMTLSSTPRTEGIPYHTKVDCIIPHKIMVYCKPYDDEVIESFIKLYEHMQLVYPDIEVMVDDWVIPEIERTLRINGKELLPKMPSVFYNTGETSRKEIDYIITLGGDGTILWASKQFRRDYFPPLIAFSHGSLGYLCNFEFDEHQQVLDKLLRENCDMHLDNRLRLRC